MNPPIPDSKVPPRILVMRYSSLGDVALTLPVLDGLLAAYPRALIHFATKRSYVPVIQHHSALQGIFALEGGGLSPFWRHLKELRRFDPHLVLDLHDSLRTRIASLFLRKARWLVYDKEALRRRMLVKKIVQGPSLHTIQKYLRVLEPLGIRPRLKVRFEIPIARKNQAFLREFLERRKISISQLVIGLGPGAKWNTKRWLAERYAELASRLFEGYRCNLFWFGSPEEVPLINSIKDKMRGTPLERGLNLPETYSLEQSITLLGRCDLFIGNDSGWAHLASGRGSRVVVIYGSTTPSLGFEPWGPHSIVEDSSLPCRPCDVHGKNACPLRHFKCMKDLTVDLVEGAVRRSVRRSR